MEGPVCLRCLLRLSRRGRGKGPRLFSQFSTTSNTIEATSPFQRNYFSANRTDAYIKYLAESTSRATGKLRGDSSEGLMLTGQLQESSSGGPSVSDGTELPHRRRKRLKTEQGLAANVTDTIPPDASSRLSTMSTTFPPSSLRRLLSLYLSLSKPRLSFLIVLTTAAAYSLYPVPALLLPQTTASPSLSTLTLVFLTSGTALCSASANALNMLMEPEHDAKMSRTRNRPLVRGYVGKRGALVFATIAGAVGIGSLYLGVNPTVAFLGGLNIFLYAGVYTPMKRISVLNTWVGAVVGGIPPLMGWAAAAGQSATGSGNWEELLFSEGSIGGWLLAALLYAWQFPHFNALSWTIRDEYKYAGYRMLAWLPPTSRIHAEWGVDTEEAALIREELERVLLDNFFAQEMPVGPPIPLSRSAREGFVRAFAAAGQISALITEASIDRYERGDLDDHVDRRDHTDGSGRPRPSLLWDPSADNPPPDTLGDLSSTFQIFEDISPRTLQDDETIANTADESRSESAEGGEENRPSQDQNLMNLLYRIAEDQARKEGYVHRGVICNSCNAMPIHGIRYRCTNCNDYDLCEQCEALQFHDKTHLFYKIRVPAPFLGNPRQPQPVWYPGKPGKAAQGLTTELKMAFATSTGIQDRQVDAYWEQFSCLAASRYRDDPHGFKVAISRSSFDQCFVPNVTPRPPPANLVYDRMFAFYDTNGDGLIGFEEFLSGIACIAQGGKQLRARIFRAYDVDNDGFVDRKDFLRMFKAYYALTKELKKQIVSGMDDEFFDEEDVQQLIVGSQPISSIFSGPIPSGELTQSPFAGKTMNSRGDLLIYDGQGIMRDDKSDRIYGGDNLVADNAEFDHFGGPQDTPWLPGIPHLTLEVEDDEWPRRWISARDVEEALGRVAEPSSIEDREERILIICASQERAQQERWFRESFRRKYMNNRWQARHFYLDGESMTAPPWAAGNVKTTTDEYGFPENDLSSLRIKALERLEEPELLEGFHLAIKRLVEETWPTYPDLDGLPERFSTWIRKRFKWHNLTEALAPTRQDIPQASWVVKNLLESLFSPRKLVVPRRSSDASDEPFKSPVSLLMRVFTEEARRDRGDTDGDPESPFSPKRASDAAELPGHEQIPGLQLTSSKDEAVEDSNGGKDEDSGSATSIAFGAVGESFGERYSVDKVPEPQESVGGEVIYQVTQESMNELLDPMFKLREDLAVAISQTWGEREVRKDELSKYMGEDFRTRSMDLFQEYQNRWYQSPRELEIAASSQAIALAEFVVKCLRKHGVPGFEQSNGHIDHAKRKSDANLQEATDAIVKLDQATANEVQKEALAADAEQNRRTSNISAGDGALSGHLTLQTESLASATRLSGEGPKVDDSTKEKPLELLLADAGYGVVTPPIQDAEMPETSPLSLPNSPSIVKAEEVIGDPTLPQNRPRSTDEWEAQYGKMQGAEHEEDMASELSSIRSFSAVPEPESLPPVSVERLVTLALWNMIEEDDQKRGGPGRLNFHDYELIMEGDKGQGLGFVGSWVETAAF
ncbi:MAG: hypothetical protein Q9185_003956 [Variospora sp. 1 TL-2023]